MPATHIDGPAEVDWENHREQLTTWYLRDGKSLQQVMSLMENNYGFVATKYQYEKYLLGKWKLRKKTKSHVWKTIAPVLRNLDLKRRKYQLYIDGKSRSAETIRKELARYARSDDVSPTPALPEKLPPGVIIRVTPSQAQPMTAVDLPFFDLEQRLLADLSILQAINTLKLFVSVDTTEILYTKISSLDNELFRQLQVATLDETDLEKPSDVHSMTTDSGGLIAPIYRNILFLLANSFEILPNVHADALLEFIRQAIWEIFSALAHVIAHNYSLRAIAKSIYRTSLQTGDAALVDFLLGLSLAEVTPNNYFHNVLEYDLSKELTPIEIATRAQRTEVSKVLLKHDANPDYGMSAEFCQDSRPASFEEFSEPASGALYHLISRHQPSTGITPDYEHFRLLMSRGADLDIETFRYLIWQDQCGPFVTLVLSRDARSRHRIWISKGIYHDIFRYQGFEVLLHAVVILRYFFGELISHSKDNQLMPLTDMEDFMSHLQTLVDITAFRGELETLQLLLELNGKISENTLLSAILGGNEVSVGWVLAQNPMTHYSNAYWEEAVAAALQSKNVQIIDLISSTCLEMKGPMCPLMKAAARTGSWGMFQYLSRLNPRAMSWDDSSKFKTLELVLACAIRDGEDEIALKLLDAEACARESRIECEYSCQGDSKASHQEWVLNTSQDLWPETPLCEALKTRNSLMVNTLLEASTIDYLPDERGDQTLVYAVEWGDSAIVKSIIDAKPPLAHSTSYKALNAAVVRANIEITDILIDAGVSIHTFGPPFTDRPNTVISPLQAAVRSGNTTMVEHILARGAFACDAGAFAEAYRQSSPMLDLLLSKHACIHSKGHKGWGGDMLLASIATNDWAVFTKLLDAGVDANQMIDNVSTPWLSSFLAAKFESGDVVQADNLALSLSGCMSAFRYAIKCSTQNGIRYVDRLLRAGGRPGCKPETIVSRFDLIDGSQCQTAFLAAVESSHVPVIELLMHHEADVNFSTRSDIKCTPLQRAVEVGNLEIVKLLIQRGADVNGPAARRGGRTALQLAAIKGYIRITHLLLKHDADVHAPASKVDGRTALEGAAENGRLDTVALLLRYYGDYEPKYEEEFAHAITYAEGNGFYFVADLLRDHQAAVAATTFDGFVDLEAIEWEEE